MAKRIRTLEFQDGTRLWIERRKSDEIFFWWQSKKDETWEPASGSFHLSYDTAKKLALLILDLMLEAIPIPIPGKRTAWQKNYVKRAV